MVERIAVVGSRAHPNLELVREYVRSLPPGTVVVSGGADGVDRAAEETAVECGLCVVSWRVRTPFAADDPFVVEEWRGPSSAGWRITQRLVLRGATARDALIFRNTLIALADRMAVFPDGTRGGCWDSARQAARFYRPVEVRLANGRVGPFRGSKYRAAMAGTGT